MKIDMAMAARKSKIEIQAATTRLKWFRQTAETKAGIFARVEILNLKDGCAKIIMFRSQPLSRLSCGVSKNAEGCKNTDFVLLLLDVEMLEGKIEIGSGRGVNHEKSVSES